MDKEKLTLAQLKENKSWEKAVIVFTEDSWERKFSEISRSYEVSREDSKYFDSSKIGTSLFGNCLDGKDDGVRLDLYMNMPHEEGVSWEVEYCYIVE